MVESIVESLRRDRECESLVDCVHGLKALDRACFAVVVDRGEAMSVDELADVVDRERSTTYRSVRRLLDAELVEKEQVNYEEGSYYHVYFPADSAEIVADMQRTLNDWYAMMGQLIREFQEKYADPENRGAAEP